LRVERARLEEQAKLREEEIEATFPDTNPDEEHTVSHASLGQELNHSTGHPDQSEVFNFSLRLMDGRVPWLVAAEKNCALASLERNLS
jgi:hypothetical protein